MPRRIRFYSHIPLTCLLVLTASLPLAASVPIHPTDLDDIARLRTLLTDYRAEIAAAGRFDPQRQEQVTTENRQIIAALRSELESRFGTRPAGAQAIDHLPANTVFDGSQNLRDPLQLLLDQHRVLILSGSDDPENPRIYAVGCDSESGIGLNVPAGHILIAEANAIIRRLPSRGRTITVQNGGAVIGIQLDGNKNAHWPAFEDRIGKQHGGGIFLQNDAAAVDCLVYDIPGIAFGTYSDRNIFWRCIARNAGHIDLKFDATFYQGRWDNWSGDGFYVRGFGNLVMDCEAYDCFRWGYTTCHGRSGTATYINSTMENTLWRTYGFIDIEDCRDDPIGSIMVDMRATQGSLTVAGSRGAIVFNSESGSFSNYNTDSIFLVGNRSHGGGLGVGGWTSSKNAAVRGGNDPIVVGNHLVKNRMGSGVENVSDWSLSVFSSDGRGVVAGNTLQEYRGPLGKGTGMQLDQVAHHHENIVEYGQWLETSQTDHVARAQATDPIRRRAMQTFASRAAELAGSLGARGQITRMVFPQIEAQFTKDESNLGPQERWQLPDHRPEEKKLRPIFLGEHWDTQIGTYHGHAWYFTTFQVTGDDYHVCDRAYLLFGGVDPECRIFINGQPVGEHVGWNKPFLLEIQRTDGPIRWNDAVLNDLAIHIHSPSGMGGVYGQVALVLTSGNEPTTPETGAQTTQATSAKQPRVTGPAIDADFTVNPQDIRQVIWNRRASHLSENRGVQVRGEGGVLSRQAVGEGVYHVRFHLDESHERFQYHVPQFVFLHADSNAIEGQASVNKHADYYGLRWDVGGRIIFFKHDAAQNQNQTLGQWQQPGPQSPARYAADEVVDLTVVVPAPGGELKVFARQANPEGEPTCSFTLPADAPSQGSFGFHNPKWFSQILIHQLAYQPAN